MKMGFSDVSISSSWCMQPFVERTLLEFWKWMVHENKNVDFQDGHNFCNVFAYAKHCKIIPILKKPSLIAKPKGSFIWFFSWWPLYNLTRYILINSEWSYWFFFRNSSNRILVRIWFAKLFNGVGLNNTIVIWECQVLDKSFHPIVHEVTGCRSVSQLTLPYAHHNSFTLLSSPEDTKLDLGSQTIIYQLSLCLWVTWGLLL